MTITPDEANERGVLSWSEVTKLKKENEREKEEDCMTITKHVIREMTLRRLNLLTKQLNLINELNLAGEKETR